MVVAVGKHIELEAFGLHAELGRNVFKDNGSEIRLSGYRAEGGEFGKTDAYHVAESVRKGLKNTDVRAFGRQIRVSALE